MTTGGGMTVVTAWVGKLSGSRLVTAAALGWHADKKKRMSPATKISNMLPTL
jgi:hypothetical protein